MLMQFLRGFGKVLGLDMNVDVPTLGMLQEGLLNVGDSMGQVQDLLVKLLSLAVCDPGLPPGQKVSEFLFGLVSFSKNKSDTRSSRKQGTCVVVWFHNPSFISLK